MNNEYEKVKKVVGEVFSTYDSCRQVSASVLRLRAGAYIVSLQENNKILLDEGICFDNMPEDVWQDYVHCRAHEFVGRYLKQKWFLIPKT